MSFYEKYVTLCAEQGLKPQTPEMLKITGVSSAAISGWKNGSMPKGEVIARIAAYFNVTTDFLLGLSKVRNISEEEELLLEAYRTADAQGRFNIIQVCMNEKEKTKSVTAVS